MSSSGVLSTVDSTSKDSVSMSSGSDASVVSISGAISSNSGLIPSASIGSFACSSSSSRSASTASSSSSISFWALTTSSESAVGSEAALSATGSSPKVCSSMLSILGSIDSRSSEVLISASRDSSSASPLGTGSCVASATGSSSSSSIESRLCETRSPACDSTSSSACCASAMESTTWEGWVSSSETRSSEADSLGCGAVGSSPMSPIRALESISFSCLGSKDWVVSSISSSSESTALMRSELVVSFLCSTTW